MLSCLGHMLFSLLNPSQHEMLPKTNVTQNGQGSLLARWCCHMYRSCNWDKRWRSTKYGTTCVYIVETWAGTIDTT